MSVTQLQAEREALGMDPNEGGAGEAQDELFERGSLDGDGIDLARLIPPDVPVEWRKSLLQGEVPGQHKLTSPQGERRAMVTYRTDSVLIKFKREDGEIVGLKITERLRPTYVEAEA